MGEIFETEGLAFLARWFHILAGITWIGLLYYFNFVQAAAFAEMEAGSRTNATQRLVPRALWWFRYAALMTFIFGLLIVALNFGADIYSDDFFKTAPGYAISTGMLLGTIMMLNVWFVIWPNQKIVIANAERVASGQEANPAAAGAARKGLLASRTNVFFSIPMLFFMAGTSHFAGVYGGIPSGGNRMTYLVISLVLIALIELNGLGMIGGTGPGPTKKPLETAQNVIIAGFVLTLIFYILLAAFFG